MTYATKGPSAPPVFDKTTNSSVLMTPEEVAAMYPNGRQVRDVPYAEQQIDDWFRGKLDPNPFDEHEFNEAFANAEEQVAQDLKDFDPVGVAAQLRDRWRA